MSVSDAPGGLVGRRRKLEVSTAVDFRSEFGAEPSERLLAQLWRINEMRSAGGPSAPRARRRLSRQHLLAIDC
jgi:hypothetical protein